MGHEIVTKLLYNYISFTSYGVVSILAQIGPDDEGRVCLLNHNATFFVPAPYDASFLTPDNVVLNISNKKTLLLDLLLGFLVFKCLYQQGNLVISDGWEGLALGPDSAILPTYGRRSQHLLAGEFHH